MNLSDRQKRHLRAVDYLKEWWRLHPEDWDRLNTLDRDGVHDERRRLHDQINAATEGHLATLVGSRDSERWTYAAGYAIGEFYRESTDIP